MVKKIFILAFVVFLGASLFFGSVKAQGDDLPKAGLTPASPFYFLERMAEGIKEFFTFNSEAKIKLHISFAAERIAEIKDILEKKGVQAKGLSVAEDRLERNLEKAAFFVAKEKEKGKDVSPMVKELEGKIESHRAKLAIVFKEKRDSLEAEGKEIEIEDLEERRMNFEEKVEDFRDTLKGEIDIKTAAEVAIKKAEAEEDVLEMEGNEGLISPEVLVAFDKLIVQARNAFSAGQFREARDFAKEARQYLKDSIKEEIKSLEKEAEDMKEGDNSGKEAREIEVVGKEFSFSPSEIKVKASEAVKIEFKNAGSYPHNFVIENAGVKTEIVAAGKDTEIKFTAPSAVGTYNIICSVPGHKESGMQGKLIVE